MPRSTFETGAAVWSPFSRLISPAVAAIVVLAASQPLHAQTTVGQDGALAGEQEGNRIVYDPAYFAQYSVTNAGDMLNRIPGGSTIISSLGSNSQERGFGSGGDQILVNGRRFPGKTNDISRALSRLRADSVLRIELIRGNSSDIDVQSSGVVVNIVLREGASVGAGGTFELNMRGNDEGALGFDGLVNYAGSTGALSYNLGIERNLWSLPDGNGQRWTDRFRDEVYFYPDGSIQELRPQQWNRLHDKWIFTAGASYDFASGARMQLNGLYQPMHLRESDVTNYTRFDQEGNITQQGTDDRFRDIEPLSVIEVGGELTAPLWNGQLTVLGIGSVRRQPITDSRNRIVGGQTFELSRTLSDIDRSEYIGRFQFTQSLSDSFALTFGAEGSNTVLRQDIEAAFDLNGDGIAESINVPTSNAEVGEWRGEAFIDGKWDPTDELSINLSLNYEYSDLSTNSVFNPGRSLQYWKPRLDLRYNVSGSTQVRLLAEREISQLDFANFVPRYNVLDNRIDAGNPGLLPESTWEFELGFEHRLGADAGVIEGKIFYEDISNAIDFFPLQQGAVLVSAQGNVGSAYRYGTEVKASLRMVPLGLRDVVVSLRGRLQDSSVTDPFTGLDRRLRSDNHYEFDLGFRHDVRSLGLAYGANYRNRGEDVVESDLFSRDLYRIGPLLAAFAELRLTSDLTLRLEAQNLLGGHEYRERSIYAVNQIDAAVRRLEAFRESRDLRYAVTIRGSF